MNSATIAVSAEVLQQFVLIALVEHGSTVNAILALEELTRRAQVEEQRQAAENAARRALGEERS